MSINQNQTKHNNQLENENQEGLDFFLKKINK